MTIESSLEGVLGLTIVVLVLELGDARSGFVDHTLGQALAVEGAGECPAVAPGFHGGSRLRGQYLGVVCLDDLGHVRHGTVRELYVPSVKQLSVGLRDVQINETEELPAKFGLDVGVEWWIVPYHFPPAVAPWGARILIK